MTCNLEVTRSFGGDTESPWDSEEIGQPDMSSEDMSGVMRTRTRRTGDMNTGEDTPRESWIGVVSCWAALGASFLLSFSTWDALAQQSGFDAQWDVNLLLITVPVWLSWAMGIAVDAYVVTSLITWMAPVSPKVRDFAKKNTYAGAAISVLAQSVYHGLSTGQANQARTWMAVMAAVVGALPPLSGALSVHMRSLVRQAALDRQSSFERDSGEAVSLSSPAKDTVPPVTVPMPVPLVSVPRPPVTLSPVPLVPVPEDKKTEDKTNGHTVLPAAKTVPTSRVSTVRVPSPRTASVSPVSGPPAWGDKVTVLLKEGRTVSQIYGDMEDTWPSLDAAKKAIQRFKKTLVVA